MKILNYPHIVKFIEVFGDGEAGSVIIIEFMEGQVMKKELVKRFPNIIPENVALDYMLKMSKIMQYLHCEVFIVHRDLHFGNWMLLENGDVKLLDFGHAMIIGENTMIRNGW